MVVGSTVLLVPSLVLGLAGVVGGVLGSSVVVGSNEMERI